MGFNNNIQYKNSTMTSSSSIQFYVAGIQEPRITWHRLDMKSPKKMYYNAKVNNVKYNKTNRKNFKRVVYTW